jgi:RNA polymerase sigma-70 factor (ECF subfamily)
MDARTSAEPSSQAERSEMRRRIESEVDGLPESLRAVFVLRALEELSTAETAAALDIPEGTVKTRLFRARSQLREALSADIDPGIVQWDGQRIPRGRANHAAAVSVQ